MIKLEKSGNATAKKTTSAPATIISMGFGTYAKGIIRFNGLACYHLNKVPKIEYFYCEEQNAIVVKPHCGTGTSYSLHKEGGSCNISVLNIVSERTGKDPSGMHLIGKVHNGQLTFPIDSLIAMDLPRGQRVHPKVKALKPSKPKSRLKTFKYTAIAKNQHVKGKVKAINVRSATNKIAMIERDSKTNVLTCNQMKSKVSTVNQVHRDLIDSI